MNKKLTHREILIKKASEDLKTAESLIKLEDYSEEVVLFHCQQAIEKILKAFLDSINIIYPKTHDLETLLSLCLKKDPAFEQIDFITGMTSYAVEFRYDEFVSIPKEEIIGIVAQTRKAFDFISKKL